MLVEQVKQLPALDRLVYWITERHQVYLKRKAGLPRPWTDDTVIQSTFFCNPYRENDKVTTWLREQVRDPLEDDPRVLFAVICFRWFNWPLTGARLMGKGEFPEGKNLLLDWDLVEALGRLKTQTGQVFTGAFNISNSGSTKPKINRVCEDYIQPAWEAMPEYLAHWDETVTLEGMHAALSVLPGLGGSGFMAAQVVADLKHTSFLRECSDWWTWCCLGPGSKRGLNRLLGRGADEPVPKNWKHCLEDLRQTINRRLKGRYPAFHAQDAQNCLCEWDKYERVAWGQGKSKRGYNGV